MYILGIQSKKVIIPNSFARLSVNKSIVIILIAIFLFVNEANSALPPLPDEIPETENTKATSTQSFFDKIFKSKKSVSPIVQPKKHEIQEHSPDEDNKEAGPLIDLGNKKLPILEPGSTLEERTAIKKVLDPLSDENSVQDTKKNKQTIENLIPSLPADTNHKSEPPVPLPLNSSPARLPLQDGSQDNQSTKSTLEALPSIVPPPEDHKATIKESEPQKIKEEIEILPATVPSFSPSPAITTSPITPTLPQDKAKVDIKAEEIHSTPASSPILLDQDIRTKKPKEQTPIPVLVKENQQIDEEDKTNKKKHSLEQKGLEAHKHDSVDKTTLTDNASSSIDKALKNTKAEEDLQELELFVKDETQMLYLPDDEIVLGVLTEEARIEQMDIRSFITLFRQIYDRQKREEESKKIDNFINNYSRYFPLIKQPVTNSILLDNAFEAIRKNNLIALKAILDYYPILQNQRIDDYTLLHEATELGNYYIAKFLIIRGININILDRECRTALEIADKHNNIACLIRQAIGAK